MIQTVSFIHVVGKKARLVLRDQRADDVIEFISRYDALQLVQREIDTMIGNTALWKIIGPDTFGTVSGTDLAPTVLRAFVGQFLAFGFVESATAGPSSPWPGSCAATFHPAGSRPDRWAGV